MYSLEFAYMRSNTITISLFRGATMAILEKGEKSYFTDFHSM